MGYITVNQDALKISLNTGIDISSATTLQILYEKPDGTKGELTGAANGMRIEVTLTAGSSPIDVAGLWKFWTKVTFSNTSTVEGIPWEEYIHESGGIHS